MRFVISKFLQSSIGIRISLSSFISAITFYTAAALSYSISASMQYAQLGISGLFIHAAMIIVFLTSVIFIVRYVVTVSNDLMREKQARLELRLHAYTQIDRLIIKELKTLKEKRGSIDRLNVILKRPIIEIQDVVSAAYNTFEAAFGKSPISEERIDFEVTFMTKSYVDNDITIPASANRAGRSPHSMLTRKSNTKIYDNTITAMIYREDRPRLHIIEDTDNAEIEYEELYPGQKQRILSSIIYPVLSDTNSILGTLVVHCDSINFFLNKDRKYWIDLLEIFSKRIALAKEKLDVIFFLNKKKYSKVTVTLPKILF